MTELGNKFACFECGTKFYDLGKPKSICPKCGADQKMAEKAERPAPPKPPRKVPEPKPAVVEEPDSGDELKVDDEPDEDADDDDLDDE